MGDLITTAPMLPGYALMGSYALVLVAAAILCLLARSWSTRFVILATLIRTAMQFAPVFTFRVSPIGLTWNATISLVIVGCAIFVIRKSAAIGRIVPMIGAMCLVILLSGVINHSFGALAGALVKYAYLMSIALVTYDALKAEGSAKVLGLLLIVTLIPFVFQLESVILGVIKNTETDNSASYIGGYNHEAAFSIVLMTALLVAALNRHLRPVVLIGVLVLCVIGILLANYRTAIIAMAPLVLAMLIGVTIRSVMPRQRIFALAGAGLLLLSAAPVVISQLGNRFETLDEVAARPTLAFQSPTSFDTGEKQILSGRVFIWSKYLYGWRQGDLRHRLVGFGPDSWQKKIGIYAHNTLISTLYETGVLGVAAMLILWGSMMAMALAAERDLRFMLFAAHAGFIILSMATMPMWMIEGLIFYGLLCGVTIYSYLEAGAARRIRPGGLAGSSVRLGKTMVPSA